jgi:hypothetical protein
LIETYGTGRNLRNLVKYLSTIAVIGLAAAYGIVSHARLPDPGTVLLYVILGFVGHHLVVAFPSGQFINLDDPVTFAALWCFGAPVAILASVPASLAQFLTRKRGLLNCLFNAGQLSLSTVAAGAVAGLLRGSPIAQTGVGEIIIAVLTIAVFDATNNAFVAVAIAIDQELTWRAVFRQTVFYDTSAPSSWPGPMPCGSGWGNP